MTTKEHYALCFRDDAITDPYNKVGVVIVIESFEERFSMFRVNWGPESEWEHPFDGAVEQHWYFTEEDTQKLMVKTKAHDGIELLNTLYERFKSKSRNADYYIAKWCRTKGIEYWFYYHRCLTKDTKKKLKEMRTDRNNNSDDSLP